MSLLYIWRNWGAERLNNSPKVTALVSGRVGRKIQAIWFQSSCFYPPQQITSIHGQSVLAALFLVRSRSDSSLNPKRGNGFSRSIQDHSCALSGRQPPIPELFLNLVDDCHLLPPWYHFVCSLEVACVHGEGGSQPHIAALLVRINTITAHSGMIANRNTALFKQICFLLHAKNYSG